MAKFHIHPVTGTPALCTATKVACPYGAEAPHYESAAEARAAYESSMEESLFIDSSSQKHEVQSTLLSFLQSKLRATKSPDAKALLRRALKEIQSDSSEAGLNRLRHIYKDASNDPGFSGAEDVRGTFRTLEALLLQAGEVHGYEFQLKDGAAAIDEMKQRGASTELAERAAKSGKLKLQESLQLLKQVAEVELQRDLNLSSFDNLKENSTAEVGAWRAEMTGLKSFYEIEQLRLDNDSALYLGTAAKATDEVELQRLNSRASVLLDSLSEDGAYLAPGEDDEFEDHSGFAHLATGGEQAVFLDEETGMVFKLRHEESGKEGFGDPYDTVTVQRVAEAYSKVDRERLHEDLHAEYVKTYFLSAPTMDGKEVGVVVQPFLDSRIYAPYSPTREEINAMESYGLSDIHGENAMINKQTKRVVLFDCLFDASLPAPDEELLAAIRAGR